MARRILGTVLALALLSFAFALRSAWAGGKKSDAEVKVGVAAAKPEGGKQVITVTLDVNKGWHIYANPVGNGTLEAAQTVVNVTGKNKPASVKVDYPKGHAVEDKVIGKYASYDGKIEIRATVERAPGDTAPLTVLVRFQACDKNSCLFPATVRKTVP